MKGHLKGSNGQSFIQKENTTPKNKLVKYISLVIGPVFNNFSHRNMSLLYDFNKLTMN